MAINKCNWKCLSLILIIIGFAAFGGIRLYYNLTDDFRLSNITNEMPNRSEWEVPALSLSEQAKIDRILDQKFIYIGKGAQSYAFGSEDGRYVVKFFKFKHLRPSVFLDILPPVPPFESYRTKQTMRKNRKLEGVFAGYRLAYETHKDASGILFLHLNKTKGIHKKLTVVDKIGRQHVIALDDVVFVIQEKAQTVRQVINELLQKKDLPLAKHRIHQIFDLYVSEYNKGIFDHDHGVMHNTGFVGDKPIHLDVGKLKKDISMKDPVVYSKDLELVARRMDNWLRENVDVYYPELAGEIEDNMTRITGKAFKL